MLVRGGSLVLLALILGLSPPVAAADGKEREQLKRLQLSLRKLQQENVRLAQEKAELEAQLKKSRLRLEGAEAKMRSTAGRTAALERSLRAGQDETAALVRRLEEAEKTLSGMRDALQTAQTAGHRLDADLQRTAQSLSACEAKNVRLHALGLELLDRYEGKGCGEAMLQAEPFTQLKRVEIENYVEDARERLDAHRPDGPAR